MSLLLAFTVPCSPYPKQRARMGLRGFYTPSETVRYEQFVILHATHVEVIPVSFHRNPVYERRPGLQAVFDAERIRIRARFFFGHRRRMDIDNVQKAIGDALVRGHIIRDDSHTVLIGWDVESGFDRVNPRAEIEIHDAGPAPVQARAPKRTKKAAAIAPSPEPPKQLPLGGDELEPGVF